MMIKSKTLKAAAVAVFVGFALALSIPALADVNTLGWLTTLILILSLLMISFAGAFLAVALIKGLDHLSPATDSNRLLPFRCILLWFYS